jgi:lipopolysaccharide export LptBFGC system permease protein LptF
MKILYRYLGTAFLRNMILCTVGLMLLVAITILFGKIDNALAGWPALLLLLSEIGKTLPTAVEIVAPLLVLIATVITVTQVGRHFELVAMKFAGLSLFQLMWPMLLGAALISALSYANQSYVNRWLMDAPGYSVDVQANRHQWRSVGDSVYYLERIDALRRSIAGVRILRFSAEPFDLTAIDSARSARKTEQGWQLSDIVARRRGAALWDSAQQPDALLPPEAFPVVLESEDADLHHAPVEEVVGAILQLQTLGLAQNLQRLELHQKLAAMCMPFLMILLATPIAQIYSRNERVDAKYVIVVMLGIVYMIGNETLFLLGKGNYLTPAVAVWSAPAIVLALALALIARSR